MAYHWIPPPPGTLKINVHAIYSDVPAANGNISGIGIIFRNHNGFLKLTTLGVIPNLSPLGNQLWAVFIALRRARIQGYRDIIIETDNIHAFRTIRDYDAGTIPAVFDITSQIDVLLKDAHWFCMLSYIFPARNRIARFLARVGMETCNSLFTLNRHVAGIEELIEWDVGLGLNHPNFVDVVIPDEAPDPVNFDVSVGLAHQAHLLGLGQLNPPQEIHQDIESNDIQPESIGDNEEVFQAGAAAHDINLYASEPPLEDID